MRIGIDCRSILAPKSGEFAGVGHYTHFLVKHLLQLDHENEYVLFFDRAGAAAAKREIVAGRENTRTRLIPFLALKRHLPFVYSHLFISSVFAKEKLDLLHAPANSLPLFYKGPSVVTIHDLAVYDHPEWFPGELPGGQTFSTRIVVPRSVSAARRVIAPSECTKRDLVSIFHADPSRIDVVPEGSEEKRPPTDAEGRVARFGLTPGNYALFVGTLEPRKNIPAAVHAFARAALRGWLPDDAVFAIAGARGWKEGPIIEAVTQANVKLGCERVRLLGYVSHEDKISLMAKARVFVFPSLYEGFGLPIIEAMRLGVPVIASNTSSIPEMADGAARLVHPKDEEGIEEALRDVFGSDELATRAAKEGVERGRLFTWDRTAEMTLTVYRKAVRKRS
jgi:glycosyltransferase involved in cell wall biosynthesis